MKKSLVSCALLLPFVACVAAPVERVRSESSAVTVDAGAGTPCVCLVKREVVPPGDQPPPSGDMCFTCTSFAQSITIAPGQTTVGIDVEAGTDWPDPFHVAFSISGLPTGVTAVYTQTGAYVPPDQGVEGGFQFFASPSAPPGSAIATITATSEGVTGTAEINVTVAGVCVPLTCYAGQCQAPPNGCSGTLSCGGCAAGEFCNSTNKCEVVGPPTCPTGTHSCGDGICSRFVCN